MHDKFGVSLLKDGFVVGKGAEAVISVIGTHSRKSPPAEGQVVIGGVEETLVGGHSATTHFLDEAHFHTLVYNFNLTTARKI